MSQVVIIVIWKMPCGKILKKELTGRNAWALSELIRSGESGCTPIDNPAPAWAAYVQNLRAMGIDIETITEPHGGPFKGHHGRYVLQSDITIIEATGLRHAA